MKTNKLSSKPAFPVNAFYASGNCTGMSIRLLLAGMAMQGLMSVFTSDNSWLTFAKMAEMKFDESGKSAIARIALDLADELLRMESE